MPQYLIIVHDGTDTGAAEQRMGVRPSYFETARQLKATNNFVMGAPYRMIKEK